MIDLRDLRENPAKYRDGCAKKGMTVDIDRLLELDAKKRTLLTEQESTRAAQRGIEKESGPAIGKLKGQIGKASGDEKSRLERELAEVMAKPAAMKAKIQELDGKIQEIEPLLSAILLTVPQPPDHDVPVGKGSEDNVEVRRWHPENFDTRRSFQ